MMSPELSPHLLSSCGSDRATEYNNSSKIIRRGDRLFVTWLDASEGAVGPTRHQFAALMPSGELVGQQVLGTAFDNHCGPALALDPNGRIHVMLGAHHQPFYYRSADSSSLQWSEPQALAEATYPAMVCDREGTLHLLYRSGGEFWSLCYSRKRAGQDWESPHKLAVVPARGYCNFSHSLTIGPSGRLHLFLNFHYTEQEGQPSTSRSAAYLDSDDGGATWWNEGERCNLPLTTSTVRSFCQSPTGGLVISATAVVDAQDRPWIYTMPPTQPGGMLMRRGDREWTVISTSDTFGRLGFNSSRGVSLTRSAAGHIHVVIATNPDGGPGNWFDPRHELFHLELNEDGRTLGFKQITETDPTTACWLPNLEKWDWTRPTDSCQDGPWLLYTRGWNLNNAWGNCRNSLRTEVYLRRLQDS